MYQSEIIKNINEQDYHDNKGKFKASLDQYEYSHDDNLKQIVTEGRNKNEQDIRSR